MSEGLPTVELHGVECTLHFEQYENRRLRIRLIDDENYPYACATVNVPEAVLAADEVLLKNYSENRGVLKALLDAGIIEDTGRTVRTGIAEANIVRLTPLLLRNLPDSRSRHQT